MPSRFCDQPLLRLMVFITMLIAAVSSAGLAFGDDDSSTNQSRAAASWTGSGQPAQYTARTWQTDDGLPNNYVQAIAQTPDGYLWVGTRGGLARFDSVSFTTFKPADTPGLRNTFVTALCVDHLGTLWVGTYSGLHRLKDGAFKRYGRDDGLPSAYITAIAESRDGSLWLGTATGVCHFVNGRCAKNYGLKDGILSQIIRCILEDRDGNIWIGTGEGLNCLTDGKMKSYTIANGFPNNSIRCLWQDKNGKLWIGSNDGLICRDGDKFHFYNVRQGLSDNFVSAIAHDREGNFWVGTYSGLNRFRDGHFYEEPNSEGADYDAVTSIFQDREGNIWAGSREGLIRLAPKRFFTFNRRQGLSHNNVMSVMEDHRGDLWVGTWGGGLNRIEGDSVSVFTSSNGVMHDLILSSCEGRDGSIWVGADYNGGITRLLNGEVTHYTKSQGLIDAAVKTICEDQNGEIWAGTSRGLCHLKGPKFITYTTKQDLPDNRINAIRLASSGDLWIGTDSGLSVWKRNHFVNYSISNGLADDTINAIYEDKEHDIWLTSEGGLTRYRDGKFTAYTRANGLANNEIFAVLEDDHGWLWMSCASGVFRVRKQDFDDLDKKRIAAVSCIRYGKTDGMESTCCNCVAQPSGWKARDGRLWFPTTKGLVAVVPDFPDNAPSPPVFIEQLIADKNPALPRLNLTPDMEVTLKPGRGDLTFQYAALNYQTPEKIRFRYQLEGVDPDWVDAGSRREVYYNHIYPGKYVFRVLACNSDGVWAEKAATLALVLQPHIWQQLWFRGLIILAGAVLIGGIARYVTHARLQRRLELLEQQHTIERERRRIAEDIHDDLGGSLTQIAILSELAIRDMSNPGHAAGHIGKITESARQTVRALDEIVWAVHPGNDTVDHLALYLWQFAEEFSANTSVRCRVDAPHDLAHHPLSSDVRHNIFLVVKEAFNNTLKHASATEMRLRIGMEPAGLAITIEDNGRGFDETAGPSGNGLSNMKKRIDAIGGAIEITSKTGQGTRIKFVVPVQTDHAD